MTPKFSVIIPVYNAEKTLHRCVDSLLNQKYMDAEFILVNDGSQDGSGEICEQYSRENAQIQYLVKENAGVSSARNAGLDAATGTYVMFVDSDDFVAENYFTAIDRALAETDCDLLQFSNFKTNGVSKSTRIFAPFWSNQRDIFIPKICDAMCRKTINSPWGKVYRRDLLCKYDIRFPNDLSIGEDLAFNINYALYINSYRVISDILYYVCTENGSSLSRKKRNDLEEQLELISSEIRMAISESSLLENERQQFYSALNFSICRDVYKTAKALHRDNVKWAVRIKVLRQSCKEMNAFGMTYPKTAYCRLVTLPIRWNLACVLDAMGWKLTH